MPTTHTLPLERRTLHGVFSRELEPVLTIDDGDTVIFQTLHAGWGIIDNPDPFERAPKFEPREEPHDNGHALCGPVEIHGAKAGMTLEVHLKKIVPAGYGFSSGGGYPSYWNELYDLVEGEQFIHFWKLDAEAGTALNQFGVTLPLSPFMGIIGMPPAEAGMHGTPPPRFCGGNLDCRELVAGSRVFIPIAVDGAMFSTGDGHGLQGDGEVSGVAIECPMRHVEIEFKLHPDLILDMPRAETPAGFLTMGLHEDLNQAWLMALNGMLDWMHTLYGFSRKEALSYASLVAHLRITQVVNGVKGVHCLLPYDALPPRGM